MDHKDEKIETLLKAVKLLTSLVIFLLMALILTPFIILYGEAIVTAGQHELDIKFSRISVKDNKPSEIFWKAPEISSILNEKTKEQVEYGKELIAHTAKYLGPKGIVMQTTNGMNCQNCHLNAGTKVFGNNYSAVASTYPKFRARSGAVEDIYKRVNDCLERSLNGKPLDTLSREMQAIKAYITFLGSEVEKGVKPNGAGFKDLAFLEREADPMKGKEIFISKCVSCHQHNGVGQFALDANEYKYPPLWGEHSYNDGAGLYRISNFAKYVKSNMPLGATHQNPTLTDEEAWDVAAFVSAQDRPHIEVPKDWPDITKKPIDHPFGPYTDSFSQKQHKFGPFKPIVEIQNKAPRTTRK